MERTPPDDELFEDDSFEWEDTEVVDATRQPAGRARTSEPHDGPRTFRDDLGRLGDRFQELPPTQRWIAVGGVAVVVVVIVVAIVLATRGGDEQTPVAEVSPAVEVDPGAEVEVLPDASPEVVPPTDQAAGGGGSSAAVTVPTDITVRAGDEGDAVRAVQQALNQLGYDVGRADGVFGPGTEAAVVTFQEDQGLPADGVVGPQTAKAMNDALTAQLP